MDILNVGESKETGKMAPPISGGDTSASAISNTMASPVLFVLPLPPLF